MLRGYGTIWHVRMHETANKVAIVTAQDREDAKYTAHKWLGRDMEKYVVTPLTTEDDQIHIGLTIAI